MRHLVLSLLLLAGPGEAGDITNRIAAGKVALASEEGQRYEASWGAVISAAMTACIPPGSPLAANLGKFTFVGDVSPVGIVLAVEVEPSTVLSRCFARHFTNANLPAPPSTLLNASSTLPIADVIEMQP